MNTETLPVSLTREEKKFLIEAAILMRDANRLAEAEEMFEAIVSLVEDKHLPMIGIGTVQCERGDYEEAVATFERATEFNPKSALAYAHLGEALAFAKHPEEAKLALRKASDLDPAGKDGGDMARTLQKFLSYGLL
jgi:superkiller protein 3